MRPPEARSDLVDLMRVVNDHISAAMGVPASVIFEGTRSAFEPIRVRTAHAACLRRRQVLKQLDEPTSGATPRRTPAPKHPKLTPTRLCSQLLNSTIQSIALAVNKVLTATYHAVYDDAKEGDELTLLTAPLCSTAELQALFEGGVIDIESALPAALHSLGCTAVEIAGAVKRRRQADQDGTDTKLLEAQNSAKLGDADVLLKSAQTGKTVAETEVVKQNVAKTKAETKKLNHDAAAPHATPGAAAAGGSSSGGKSSAKK